MDTDDNNNTLILEDDNIINEETLYLSSIPRYVEKIKEIREKEDWSTAKEFDPNIE